MAKRKPATDPKSLARWLLVDYKPEGKTPYSTFKRMIVACWDAFKYVTTSSGYDPRSNQQWVHVKLGKDADIDAAQAELDLFLPYIRETDGYKKIGVFEFTLSADGMFELRQYGIEDIRLIKTRYNVPSELQRFASWRAAFEYVRTNHWCGYNEDYA